MFLKTYSLCVAEVEFELRPDSKTCSPLHSLLHMLHNSQRHIKHVCYSINYMHPEVNLAERTKLLSVSRMSLILK